MQLYGSWWPESFWLVLKRRAAINVDMYDQEYVYPWHPIDDQRRRYARQVASSGSTLGGRHHDAKKVLHVQTTDGDITVRISARKRLTGKRIKRAIEEEAGHRSDCQLLFSGDGRALGGCDMLSEGDQVAMLISNPVWDRVYEAIISLPGADERSDNSKIATLITDSFDTRQGELDTSQPFFYGAVASYEDLEWRLDGLHSTHDERDLLATNIKVLVDVDWFDMDLAEEFVRALICAVSSGYTDPDIIELHQKSGRWSFPHGGRDEYPVIFATSANRRYHQQQLMSKMFSEKVAWGVAIDDDMTHIRDLLRYQRNPSLKLCWLRFFVEKLTDIQLAVEVHSVGVQGITTDQLYFSLRKYKLLDEPTLFYFERAATGSEMHHVTSHHPHSSHAQEGATSLTAREILAVMRRSEHLLGSKGGQQPPANALLTPPPSL